ncbi:MAG: sigma-54 dependent transcriptional regulator [Acidobacteriota bacterium]
MTQILVVEDRDSLRRLMCAALEGEGFAVTPAASVGEARDQVGSRSFDLALTDLKLPDGSGIDVLRTLRRHQREVPVVVLTAYGSVSMAVEAMKLGAVDFLEKPVELDDLFELVRSLVTQGEDIAVFQPPGDAPAIVGRHPRLRAALRLLRKVAPTQSTVLLTGESGTGKELFARALHALSPRSTGPFVAVNCAAIPETLMETELFGHEKGAFTGAAQRRSGRFEQANGGTLFLDEIGELELQVQGKVLRVLEERVFDRVGGSRSVRTDVRIVAATNRDLAAMSRRGTFRQDLYYRLDVFPIELPPLRERASDIPDLARHLTVRLADRLGRRPADLGPAVLDRLASEPWPGNVRQLANLLERALILCEDALELDDLEALLAASRSADPARGDSGAVADAPGAGTADDDETRLRRALLDTDGDKARAAERLGISYRTLQRRIREYDLEGFPRYRS